MTEYHRPPLDRPRRTATRSSPVSAKAAWRPCTSPTDLKHNRKVALKVLKPDLAAVLGAERFVQEITTTASLQHPHILPLFDSGTAVDSRTGYPFLYYVMPYIEGETLRDKIDREKQLAIDEAVEITSKIRGRARLCASARGDPSRYQAREHPAARWASGGRGFRHRVGRECMRPAARMTETGLEPRHAALHVARTGDRGKRYSRIARTSTRWAVCCTRCSPATHRTWARRRSRSS